MAEDDLKETNEIIKKVEKHIDALTRDVNRISSGWGMFVEGMMIPSAVNIFSKMGYAIKEIWQRHKIRQNEHIVVEYDVLMAAKHNGKKCLFVGEAKSQFTPQDIDEFAQRIFRLKEYAEEYKDYEVIGFTAGMNYGRGVDTFAIREGFYVLKPAGEIMVVEVPEGFRPKIF